MNGTVLNIEREKAWEYVGEGHSNRLTMTADTFISHKAPENEIKNNDIMEEKDYEEYR